MYMPELDPAALGALVYRDLAEACARSGDSFECLGAASLPLSAAWLRAGALGAPLFRTPRFFAYTAALARWLRGAPAIDVLHIEIAYPTAAAAALAIAWSGWKGLFAVSPMGEDVLVVPEASYGFRRHPVPRALVDWTMRRAGAVRAISPLVLDLVRREWPRATARAIPLNVARAAIERLDDFPASVDDRRRRARRVLEDRYAIGRRPVVLALGRLHPFKGIDVLIEAMESLADAHLLVAGPSLDVKPIGDVATSLAALARRRGFDGRVTFLGKVAPAEALDLLAGADVLAVPSRRESMNRVCVEAAAVGTPFVVTETTGVAGWLPGDGVGVVVPPENPTALADAINRVIAGGFARDPEQARQFVRRFAPEKVAAELVEFYRPLVAR